MPTPSADFWTSARGRSKGTRARGRFEGGWEVCAVDACPGELSKEILRGVKIASKGLTDLVVIFNARRMSIGSVVTVSCPDAIEAAFERCG